MTDHDFDLSLRLLSRRLGLTESQRGQIAAELRDHVEERLNELTEAGVPREQARVQALDDIGDAAFLAARFTITAPRNPRRALMRLSLSSATALAAVLFVGFAFWPENGAFQGPASLFAQNKSTPTQPGPSKPALRESAPPTNQKPPVLPTQPASSPAPARRTMPAQRAAATRPTRRGPARPASEKLPELPALLLVNSAHALSSDVGQEPRIEAVLEATSDFTLEPQPLADAIGWLAARYQIPIMGDTKSMEDANIDTKKEVKLPIKGLKVRQVLTLLLAQLPQRMSFDIEDGVLWITTLEKIRERKYVVVYDCRDLIHLRSMMPAVRMQRRMPSFDGIGMMGGMGTGGGGMFDVLPGAANKATEPPGKAAAKPEEKTGESVPTPCAEPLIPLIQVIKYAGETDDWQNDEGSHYGLTELGGLIAVNQNSIVHQQIRRILADLRRMKREGAFATSEKSPGSDAASGAPRANDKGF
jgi:hypothetical protein